MPPKTIAFDILGTCFPLTPLRPHLAALGLPEAALETWYTALLRDAFALSATGAFAPLADILRATLAQLLATNGATATDGQITGIIARIASLPPREGLHDALTRLKAAQIPAIALTNGARATTETMLRNAGLADLMPVVASVETPRIYKPRREAYDHGAAIAGHKPADLVLVAIHPWDLNGAKSAGWRTAYLTAGGPWPPYFPPPDFAAPTVPTLIEACVRG